MLQTLFFFLFAFTESQNAFIELISFLRSADLGRILPRCFSSAARAQLTNSLLGATLQLERTAQYSSASKRVLIDISVTPQDDADIKELSKS